jgi:circadian clock protein KaiB
MSPDQYASDGEILLQLYVAGRARHSLRARANLSALLEAYASPGEVRLEVIDVLEEPKRALEAGILITPSLVQLAPSRLHLVGALNDRQEVARLLGLGPAPGEVEG